MTDSLRALKFLVIAMGVVIVVGTAVVVITIFQRAAAPGSDAVSAERAERRGPARPEARGGFGTQQLEIPRGSRIADMIAEDDRLILRLELADGTRRIVVLDTESGARLGTFEIRESP